VDLGLHRGRVFESAGLERARMRTRGGAGWCGGDVTARDLPSRSGFFRLDLGLNSSGDPTPSPAPQGALGDSGRNKSARGPNLSATMAWV
jgi:hypothetical protein